MAVPPKKAEKETSDFDISEILAGQEGHGKNISDLTARVAKIEGNFQTPQAVAAFFQECTRDSRKLDGIFAEMFCRFMDEHDGVREAIKAKMEDIDRSFFYKTFKRLWLPIYSVVLIVGTVVLKDVVQWLLSLIPHK